MQQTLDLLAKGGPVIIVIIVCSIVAMGLFLERLFALQRQRVLPPHFVAVVMKHLREQKSSEARALCEANSSSIASVLSAGIEQSGKNRSIVRESMQDRGRLEAAELERNMGALGAIASVTPLLGLLGTITGMIATFKQVNDTIVTSGQVSPGALANGIWEALITTAAGLTVAIPTFLCYKYLVGRLDRTVAELEDTAVGAVDIIAECPRLDGKTGSSKSGSAKSGSATEATAEAGA